jgi:hypothetical protein
VLTAQTGATLAEGMARIRHATPPVALRHHNAARGRDAKTPEVLLVRDRASCWGRALGRGSADAGLPNQLALLARAIL